MSYMGQPILPNYTYELDIKYKYMLLIFQKLPFKNHNGHFKYLVMPFGLHNALSTFQAIMNSIFHHHLHMFILVSFYDILYYRPTWKPHIKHVRTTLDIIRQHQFFIKASKYDFEK